MEKISPLRGELRIDTSKEYKYTDGEPVLKQTPADFTERREQMSCGLCDGDCLLLEPPQIDALAQ